MKIRYVARTGSLVVLTIEYGMFSGVRMSAGPGWIVTVPLWRTKAIGIAAKFNMGLPSN
jgi:hypothetical protein